MLFDLRSRGRRRVIRVVYLGLAVLIGLGLIGFGVGTGSGFGGLFTASTNSGTATGLKRYEGAVKRAQRAASASPSNPALWDRLALAAYALANVGGNYVTGSGYTSSGAKQLAIVKRAWQRYLALGPAKPDQTLAADVAAAFGVSPGVAEYAVAESAAEVLANAPSATYATLATLAEYAYLAGEFQRGDLAAARAEALAPASSRKTLTSELAQLRSESGGSTAASGTTGTTGSTGSTTATGTTGSTGGASTSTSTGSTAKTGKTSKSSS